MTRRRRHPRPTEDQKRRVFNDLYESMFDQILVFCRRRSLSSEDAEDAAAQTYLTAWQKVDDAVEADSSRRWLFAVAFRVTANQRRSRDRHRHLIDRLKRHARRSSADFPEAANASDHPVHAALATLSPQDQEIVCLSTLEDLPHVEIGRILGITRSAVGSRLHRAKQQLKTHPGLETYRGPAEQPPTNTAESTSSGLPPGDEPRPHDRR